VVQSAVSTLAPPAERPTLRSADPHAPPRQRDVYHDKHPKIRRMEWRGETQPVMDHELDACVLLTASRPRVVPRSAPPPRRRRCGRCGGAPSRREAAGRRGSSPRGGRRGGRPCGGWPLYNIMISTEAVTEISLRFYSVRERWVVTLPPDVTCADDCHTPPPCTGCVATTGGCDEAVAGETDRAFQKQYGCGWRSWNRKHVAS
jgi:hypothetical protein